MNILVITCRLPLPNKKGDQVLAYYRIMYLSKLHTVKVITYGDSNSKEAKNLQRIFQENNIAIEFIHLNYLTVLKNLLFSSFNDLIPYQVSFFKSETYRKSIIKNKNYFKPDFMYCITVRSAGNIDFTSGEIVMDLIDSMALNFQRKIKTANWYVKWLLKIECDRVSKYESGVANKSLCSFVVSKHDQMVIGSPKVLAIPLGVDISIFKQKRHYKNLSDYKHVIIFSGNMSYQPNIDAVTWFTRHCWALLKNTIPDVIFKIVGNAPSSSIRALAKNNLDIIVTGRVDSIANEINQAHVAIAPMQSGSGMQFKVLEAMACGIPVVLTSLGLGDIDAVDNTDLLVADTPHDFVAAIIRLLNSSELTDEIGNNGCRFVSKYHSWDAVNSQFLRKLESHLY